LEQTTNNLAPNPSGNGSNSINKENGFDSTSSAVSAAAAVASGLTPHPPPPALQQSHLAAAVSPTTAYQQS